jgi:hypothetical protein
MQQMYDAVRATGAENLVVIGGLYWAFDLSNVPRYRVAGHNIMYATHPYGGTPDRAPNTWDGFWGSLTATDPVIATEFGDSSKCDGGYSDQLIKYADAHNASWTAWAWYYGGWHTADGGCSFPSLIDDWNGTPSSAGAVVKNALSRY